MKELASWGLRLLNFGIAPSLETRSIRDVSSKYKLLYFVLSPVRFSYQKHKIELLTGYFHKNSSNCIDIYIESINITIGNTFSIMRVRLFHFSFMTNIVALILQH